MRRVWPGALWALPVLAIARALPAHGFGLWLRLGAGTLCVLLPGILVSRALGRRGASAALTWSLAALFASTAVMFAVHSSLWLALGLYAGIGAAALPFAMRVRELPPRVGTGAVFVLGVLFGIAVWHVAGTAVGGDGLFHLARVRKLDDFGGLTLRSVDEFRDGGLHPGYAFPLWHSLLALVARLAGVDPAKVVLHESALLVPAAFLVAYEAGVAVFRSAAAGFAALLASVAVSALAAGHGGLYTSLDLPATAALRLLVPAAIALFFSFLGEPSRAALVSVAAAGGALALVHPTYALFLAIPLAGFVVARIVLARREIAHSVAALAALVVPAGAVGLWLLPIVRETASHNPHVTEIRRSLEHYRDDLDVSSLHRYRLAPAVFDRTGAVAVLALLAVPLAGLAPRARWAALVLGGSLAVFALTLPSFVFPHFADAVSLSQARRFAGFVPVPFALAGGLALLARFAGLALLPLALGAGILLELECPGRFGGSGAGGPGFVTWIAAWGAVAALLVGLALRRERRWRPALGAWAAALLVLPVAVHGFSHWSARTVPGSELTPGLVHVLRTEVPKRAVVFSDLETSYRIAAFAPVYVAAAPPAHVADTKANHPYRRRADVIRFFRTGDLAVPRSYGAGWIVLDRTRSRLRLQLPRAYQDARYVLYRIA